MTEPVLVNQPSAQGNARVIKMAAVGGVLVLALFVGPKVLGGGGGGGDDSAAVPPTSTPTAPSNAPSSHGDTEVVGIASSRDPFAPLMDLSAGTDTSTQSAESLPAGPGPDALTPVLEPVDLSGDTGGGSQAATTPTTAPPPPPVHRLSLLEIFADQDGRTAARVRVDDDVMETLVGQDFGGNYRTFSLDRTSGCGVFLYGDQRLTLCEGHEAIT